VAVSGRARHGLNLFRAGSGQGWSGPDRKGEERRGRDRTGKAWFKSFRGMDWNGGERIGTEGLGLERWGEVLKSSHGRAWLGEVRHELARHGWARLKFCPCLAG
jgi:hypothetical protein